jgi:hypothetical protein
VKSLQQLDWVPRNPGVPSIAIEGFEPTEQGASGGIYSVDCWVCLQMEPQFMASSMGNIMVNHQIIKSSIKERESPHFSGKITHTKHYQTHRNNDGSCAAMANMQFSR